MEWIAAGDEKFLARANWGQHGLVERSNILVLASHSAELLRSICNRAVLIKAGGVVAVGTVDEILDQYRR